MRHFIIPYLLFSIFAFHFFSCKKYLDAKASKSLVVPSSVGDFQALLDNTSFVNLKNPSLADASADEYYLSDNNYTSQLSVFGKKAYTWQLQNYSAFPNDWSYIYDGVQLANTVLDGITNASRNNQNNADWDNVKGSALFLRAESFLKAAFTFSKTYDEATAASDYGIALRLSSDFNIPSVRANNQQTYDRIIMDIKEAVPLLPVTPKHVMRPSRPAAYGLLARTYLEMRKYDSAGKYADACLQLYSKLYDYNAIGEPSLQYGLFDMFNPEVINYDAITSYVYNSSNAQIARIDTAFYKTYADNDLRSKVLFLNPNGDGILFKGSYSGYWFQGFCGIATDEVYLMRAESNARTGKVIEAMNDLNALLVKRWKTGTFIPFTASTATAALDIILKERRKELLFRGLRWADIKRLNRDGANIIIQRTVNGQPYTLQPNANTYALQLPADIINMTGMPQNPL